MRVNIQYSCDLEEVPREMARLIENALVDLNLNVSEALEEIRGTLNFSSDLNELIEAIQKIETTRHVLNALDHTLADCDQVLKGYVTTRDQLEKQAAAAQEEPTVNEIVTQIEEAESNYEEEVTDEGN